MDATAACSIAKYFAAEAANRCAYKAVQIHGAGGVSQDFPVAAWFAQVRTLRLADGPDEVHKNALARNEIRKVMSRAGA